MRRQSRTLLLVIALSAAAIVGSIIGEALADIAPFLARGFSVGLEPPFVLNLNVISLTFGFTLGLNVMGAILVLLVVLFIGR